MRLPYAMLPIVALLAACTVPADPSASPSPTRVPDTPTPVPTHTPAPPAGPPAIEGQILPTGQRFVVAVPENYSGEQAVPLVLALHYSGHGDTPFYGQAMLVSLVEPALRELGGIIVAPDCPGSDWTDPQSEASVLAVLDHVEETYNIDPRRRLITGYSMGGIGTWHMAAHHPDRFTAAVVMAGYPSLDVSEVEWEVPLYILHSVQDEVIPLEPTQAAVEVLQGSDVPVKLVILDGVTHYQTARFVVPLREAIPWLREVWQ